jgi:hypothetical protein
MRYYPREVIERLRQEGRVIANGDNDVLTITLPEPGGAKVREDVRAIEDTSVLDYLRDHRNPYLREYWADKI